MTLVVLHLSLGVPVRLLGGLRLLISCYKGSSPFPTTGKRTYSRWVFQEHVLESSLDERRSVAGCCVCLTPLLFLLSLSKKSSMCSPAFLLILHSAIRWCRQFSPFHLFAFQKAHPLRVWHASECTLDIHLLQNTPNIWLGSWAERATSYEPRIQAIWIRPCSCLQLSRSPQGNRRTLKQIKINGYLALWKSNTVVCHTTQNQNLSLTAY